MKSGTTGMIHVLEFGCQAPLRFYEHCTACPRFGDNCTDLMLGKEILMGRKKLSYDSKNKGEGFIHASAFNCTAPLRYVEKSRGNCGHKGRCRDEGLLLALLSGKKELTYTQKTTVKLPYPKRRRKGVRTQELAGKEAIRS